jgi:hypothetical protein
MDLGTSRLCYSRVWLPFPANKNTGYNYCQSFADLSRRTGCSRIPVLENIRRSQKDAAEGKTQPTEGMSHIFFFYNNI